MWVRLLAHILVEVIHCLIILVCGSDHGTSPSTGGAVVETAFSADSDMLIERYMFLMEVGVEHAGLSRSLARHVERGHVGDFTAWVSHVTRE